MFRTARDAWALIPNGRRRRFVQVTVLAGITALVEMSAALAIAALLSLLLEPGVTPTLPVLGDLAELRPSASYEQLVIALCAGFGLLFLFRALLFYGQQYITGRVIETTSAALASRLVEGYLSLPYEWHIQRNSAELVRNAWDAVLQIKASAFGPLARVGADFVLIVSLVAVLVSTSPLLSLAAGVTLAVVLVLTMFIIQPAIRRYGQTRHAAAQGALRHLQQGFMGIRDVKVSGAEVVFGRAFQRDRRAMAVADYRKGALTMLPKTALETAFFGLLLGGVAWSVSRGNVESTLASLGVFAYAGLRLQPALQSLARAMNSLRFAEAAVSDLRTGLEELDVARALLAEDNDPSDVVRLTGELVLAGVGYQYPAGDSAALASIDLTIPAASTLGIVGATGGGKSTLLDVLVGLLSPTEGTVSVDGVSIEGRTRAWQRSIGVVHQDAFLIDDTLRANIALGAVGAIDEEHLRWCVRTVQLEDTVAAMQDGLDTVVGESGSRLSGGQRQRVTVARALYRRPSVLVLDEGTASLDNATERRLVAALALVEGLTTITVAHRLSTVAECDQIVVLDEGSIVGRGSYEELLRDDAGFQELVAGAG